MGTQAKTLLWRVERRTFVCVHAKDMPTDEEWMPVVDAIEQLVRQGGTTRVLVHTEGGAPDAGRRAQLSQVLGGIKPRVSVLASSVVARTAGTALSWFIPNFKTFALDQVDQAIEHLEVGRDDHLAIRQALAELRAELRRYSTHPPGPDPARA